MAVYVVVLDEIDHLLKKDQETLYSLFEWSLAPGSRLILVGIANALDLTERFLPRLKGRNLKPQLLQFHPYSVRQITEIVTVRLKSLLPDNTPDKNYIPYIQPNAIELCARKIAHTGDIRKAFDMCRLGLELLDRELKEKARKEAETLNNPPTSKPKIIVDYDPRVTPRHIVSISSNAFGSPVLNH